MCGFHPSPLFWCRVPDTGLPCCWRQAFYVNTVLLCGDIHARTVCMGDYHWARTPCMDGMEFSISSCQEQVSSLTQNNIFSIRDYRNMLLLKNMVPLDTPIHSGNGVNAVHRCCYSRTFGSFEVYVPSSLPQAFEVYVPSAHNVITSCNASVQL